GEALASVAAVADVECRSGGARVRLRGGELVEQGVAMPAPGTVLEVRDLFAQTPARLKFLKSEATETSLCLRAVQPYALLYPEVRFVATIDGRTVLRTPGSGDPLAAIGAVLGGAVAEDLVEVAGDGVAGHVSEPRLSRGTRDLMLLAVNRRPIASRSLTYAIEECYLGSLERGRHPVTVLRLELPPDALDVNVHPAKREVRFHDERAWFATLQRAIREALGASRPYALHLAEPPAVESDRAVALEQSVADLRHPTVHDAAPRFEGPLPSPPAAVGGGILRPLGQVDDAYVIAEGADGVVLVDQHAAHERILYNRFLSRLRDGPPASQPLLLPETLDLEPSLVATALDHRERLRALGFDLEEFGPTMLRVLAGPVETPPARLREAVLELLSLLAERGHDDLWERAAASLACHSAIRFGDRLEGSEQRRLLDELAAADPSTTCPHGRPTRLVLSWQDLRRHFHRNY
ncbi:MAG: DNA mismatch repair endonuclease MutL, partial [Candidatus Dormiibacterota bacterium]